MRILLASLFFIPALSCTKPSTTPTGGACTSASDCALICFENDRDCCGDACGCEHAFPKAEAERITRERNDHCAKKDIECPEVKCVMKQLEADCVEGKCVAVTKTVHAPPPPPPTPTECTSDDECAMTTLRAETCCDRCEPIGGTKQAIAALHAKCNGDRREPHACPKLDCPAMKSTPKCVAGTCSVFNVER